MKRAVYWALIEDKLDRSMSKTQIKSFRVVSFDMVEIHTALLILRLETRDACHIIAI